MAETEQQRVPLAEAWRLATGQEPPPPMTDDERREWDAKLEDVREQHRRIYGDAEAA
jgi:hypothetical protein